MLKLASVHMQGDDHTRFVVNAIYERTRTLLGLWVLNCDCVVRSS